ncbi:MAG: hypothetical protein FJ265_18345, partial [Planctomycetes bacterium]|nr:hypothetical protein [Planctomycetota bacterium]
MKRALLFLLLLAAGIVILRLSIGEDEVVVAGAPGAPAPAGNPGVRLEQGPIGASWQARGPFHYPRFRSVPEAGGGTRNELVFELDAADSQPVGEGLQQLDGVTVVFHDRGQPAARLVSRQAFLELGRDAGGRASLREDKEIDLRDAVFTTAATSRLPGLRLELDRVLVLVREDYLQLRTPNETDPVLVVLDGKQRGSLRGNGLRARLPRDRRGPLQRADVEVLHDPVFATDGLAVRARGRMSYREDLAAGTAELTVERDVQVETGAGRLFVPGLPGPRGDAAGDGRATVHADELSGWLLRTGEHGDGLVWRLVQLRGAPVAVAAQGLRITAPRLALLPGLFGEPLLATASGGPSRIEQVLDAAERRPGAEPFVASSPRRIHLLRPGEQASAAHRAFGFPRWTVRSVQQQHVVVLEARPRASTGARAVTASRGLHVFRPDPEVEFAVVQGFGDVSVTQPAAGSKQPELGARGDDGFLLRFAPAGSRLELGPPLPADSGDPGAAWRRHRYELRRGAASVR